uniref:Secreted protein n=1 Tax=Anopheles culicifacies TaxID=139723 RepID=A0A182LS76_9DIPT
MSCASRIILLRTTVGQCSAVTVATLGSVEGSGTGSNAERSGISDTPSVSRRTLPTVAIICCCSCWLRSSSRPRAESELDERVTLSRFFIASALGSSSTGTERSSSSLEPYGLG